MTIDENSAQVTYTLRFPFKLAPGRELEGLDEPFEHEIEGLVLELQRKGDFYVLTVRGFPSEEAARAYASRLWTGLMWVVLERGDGFTASLDFDEVEYLPNPQEATNSLTQSLGVPITGPVDGLADGMRPTVYPSHKRIRFISVGPASITVGSKINSFYSALATGISLPRSSTVVLDERLMTALELYNAYFYEHSDKARFLTLVIALEALTTGPLRHQVALNLIDKWKLLIAEEKSRYASSSEEYHALESLEKEAQFKKQASLRSQVRTLVYETLVAADSSEQEARLFARRTGMIYNQRSTLVHTGTLPPAELHEALQEAKVLIELVLKAKLKSISASDSPRGHS